MCSAPNVYMFVYILIGTHLVPLISGSYCNLKLLWSAMCLANPTCYHGKPTITTKLFLNI